MSFLLPSKDPAGTINIPALLASPSQLNAVLARLTEEQLVCGEFFAPAPGGVAGGGVRFGVLKAGVNYLERDAEQRAPGAAYVLSGSDMPTDLAVVQDWGSKVQILDEEHDRYDAITLANKLTQLANTVACKIDALALAAVDAALTAHSIGTVPGHDWSTLVTVGPDDQLTPNTDRPTADFANANLLAAMDDIGIGTLDTLVCHPQEHARLKIGYGIDLAAVLASAGITKVRTSVQIAPGVAYLVENKQAGRTVYERPLTTEVIDDRHHRAQYVQSYVVPAFAVSKPGAVRKITGLAG
ncbi:major capsid protein [Nocardia brevicatena]|uniref:major capsid protein n=1 Tax=Nocardia brevicatena TaxID=37327 RepID=UPI001C3F2F84|nr:major capsid protein [Nocardia brevicatena]